MSVHPDKIQELVNKLAEHTDKSDAVRLLLCEITYNLHALDEELENLYIDLAGEDW